MNTAKLKKTKGFKFAVILMAFSMFTLITPNLFAALCPYLVGPEFNGAIDHCYRVSLDAGLGYSTEYCVYVDQGGYGREASGETHTIPSAQAELC